MNETPRTRRPNILSLYFISVSLTGLILLAALTFSAPTSKVSVSWRKPVMGSIFGAICLLGIIAGIYPSRCSEMLHFRKKIRDRQHYDTEQESARETVITFEGHHPRCDKFSPHVFQFGDKKYCAGCSGLAVGAAVSLLGTFVYFFFGFSLGEMATVVFWLGLAGVALGLLQYNLFNIGRSFVHLFLNVIFVVGAFLLLVGIEEVAGNPVLEVYFVALTLYWILTRILLSQQEHRKICSACGSESCSFL